MNEIFLAELCGYWCLFARESVRAVVPRPSCTVVNREERAWLILAEKEAAEVCPLHLLFNWPQPTDAPADHLLVLRRGPRLCALPMHGPGRDCMARLDMIHALPPAFPALSRRLVPGLLVNGNDVIMRVNLGELLQAMDKIAQLRRKKRLARQQADQAGGGRS